VSTFSAHITADDGTELEIHGEVEPIRPGRFSGPPELCYPEEGGEVEVERVEVDGEDMTPEDAAKKYGVTIEAMAEALAEAAERNDELAAEDAAERRRELRKDR